jgi:hypothetical protein
MVIVGAGLGVKVVAEAAHPLRKSAARTGNNDNFRMSYPFCFSHDYMDRWNIAHASREGFFFPEDFALIARMIV